MIRLDELFPDLYKMVGFNNKGSMEFKHSSYPVSIAAKEYEFIYNLAKDNELCAGYEVATGTGLSAIAFAKSMQDASLFGYILTVDSYIEESENSCDSYFNKKDIVKNSKGFETIRTVLNSLDLRQFVDLNIGRSPDDIPDIVEEQEMFDYVFIDAQHTTDALMADLDAISPHVLNNAFVLIHDMHCFDRNEVEQKCFQLFGAVPKLAPGCGLNEGGYNLNYLKVNK